MKPLEQSASDDETRASIAGVRELVVSTLQDVRRLAVELRPSALDDFGLGTAVERLVETFRERSGLQVDLEEQLATERVPGDVETTVYRIVQEALTNVAKHADATRVSILLVQRGASLVAVIEDDGKGFEPGAVADTSLGLAGMRERVALVGGRLRIESSANGKTAIVAEIPSGVDAVDVARVS